MHQHQHRQRRQQQRRAHADGIAQAQAQRQGVHGHQQQDHMGQAQAVRVEGDAVGQRAAGDQHAQHRQASGRVRAQPAHPYDPADDQDRHRGGAAHGHQPPGVGLSGQQVAHAADDEHQRRRHEQHFDIAPGFALLLLDERAALLRSQVIDPTVEPTHP
ncbi:hypothetical protein ACFJI1_13700 [Pseudoxanthomonas sp. UC29_72]